MGAPAPRTVAFTVRGPITRADLPGLTDHVCALLRENRGSLVLCDVRGVGADCVTVDALARLQLAARRHDCRIRLRHASQELLELVAFMGLANVLPEWRQASTRSGSPNSGKITSVSRKNVNSTICPFSISSTWSAQAS
jgi:hypothetical protein